VPPLGTHGVEDAALQELGRLHGFDVDRECRRRLTEERHVASARLTGAEVRLETTLRIRVERMQGVAGCQVVHLVH
jgi:hypothetical protein